MSWSSLGHQVVMMNLVNSNRKSLEVVERIAGVEIPFYEGRYPWYWYSQRYFQARRAYWVWFPLLVLRRLLAGPTRIPLAYYDNNIAGTVSLLKIAENNCKNIIFSSSATVYGDPHTSSILEDFSAFSDNPYGRTKLMLEEILTDIYKAGVRMERGITSLL